MRSFVRGQKPNSKSAVDPHRSARPFFDKSNTASDILHLQHVAGNHAVQQLLQGSAADSPRIALANDGHAGRLQVQRREDMDYIAQGMMDDVKRESKALLKQYSGDPAGLATRLIADMTTTTGVLDDWDRRQVAYRVLDGFSDQAGLANAIAQQLPDARVRQLVPMYNSALNSLALTVRRGGNGAEAERIMSIVVDPAHGHLFGETASQSPMVQGALWKPGVGGLQSISGGTGSTVFDEYWIVMDAMPANLTAEAFLAEMTQDLNAAVQSDVFDDINEFERTKQDRQRGAPAVGDVYDIDIQGPDNGSVMLVESAPNHFIFQTIYTSQTGDHPEYGSREFGFEMQKGGAVRWYTRGASRPGYDLASIVGASKQKASWTALVTGIGNALQSRGGRLRSGSFGHWIRRL